MKLIYLDMETFYGDDYTLSLKDMTTERYIRDERFKAHGASIAIDEGPIHWVTARKLPAVLKAIDLENNALVGHNLQFDGTILAWHYNVVPKLYIDTLGLSRAMVGPHSARHGLTFAAKLLCGLEKPEGELVKTYNIRDLSPAQEEALAVYCNNDVHMTREILRKMLPHFPKSELKALDWTVRAFTQPRLYLDTELLYDYIAEVQAGKAQALVDAGLDNRDVLMSNPKFAAALEAYGVNPPTKINAKGEVTFAFAKTDEGLKALLDHPQPEVQAIVAARLAVKSTIEETRAILYHDASTRGAWPVGYNYSGAMGTHRFSGNKGGGGNPQNLKRKGTLRRAIYVPEGEVCGVVDLSQIEARATLWCGMQLTGPDGEEAAALDVMRKGGDLYSWFGEKIYGYSFEKDSLERQVSKSAVLGLGYGMGPGRFIDYAKIMGIKDIDEKFAENIVFIYRNTFKGVRKFWSQCNKALNLLLDGQTGVALPFEGVTLVRTQLDPLFNEPAIRLPNGLMIKYPQLEKNADGEITYMDGVQRAKLFGGKVCQNIMEGVTGQIIREHLTMLRTRYPVVMQTHDELVCIVPEDEDSQAEFKAYARGVMTQPINFMPGLPVGVEVSTAIRYGDAK